MGLAPINDPTVNPGPLTAAVYKVPAAPAVAPVRRSGTPSGKQLRAVLNYLLK
jgi:hypothetical protein